MRWLPVAVILAAAGCSSSSSPTPLYNKDMETLIEKRAKEEWAKRDEAAKKAAVGERPQP